ncbi:MAG: hypothetical protein KKE11_04315 [Gammaproteobacteria bacterium]|nr:hypothetical protein [Gammaproteobacteria bacterium]
MKKFLVLRLLILKNKLKDIRHHSLLKIIVVWLMIVGLFAGTFYVPLRAFLFLLSLGNIGVVVIDRLLYLLFMGLFVMLVFSNCIIFYSTAYQAKETAFLYTLPVKYTSIFIIKFFDSAILSSWAFLCFLIPIISAYAWVRHLDWFFYFALVVFFIPFAMIACAIGCLLTVFIVRFIPPKIYRFLALIVGLVFIFGIAWLLIKGRSAKQTQEEFLFLLTQLIPHFSFTQFVFAPNYWISEGLFKAISLDYKHSIFWWLLLASNALFLGQIAIFSSKRFYYPGWVRSAFWGQMRNFYSGEGFSDKVCKKLVFLKPALRSLVLKDIKTFGRDPVQWSQFTIFFGLLAIYFANLRSLGYENLLPFWKNVVSFLNLAATNLTLASLSVRFVFPQFSLEGRKFWILGLAPLKMKSLLYEKFFLNNIFALTISIPLILLSNFMLKVSALIMLLSVAVVILMAISLISLCIGLGTIFPNFREDNPAQIVSGFGGTLALVLSLFYIAICVGALALPFHLLITEKIDNFLFEKMLWGLALLILIISLSVMFSSIHLGCRALEKMEI